LFLAPPIKRPRVIRCTHSRVRERLLPCYHAFANAGRQRSAVLRLGDRPTLAQAENNSRGPVRRRQMMKAGRRFVGDPERPRAVKRGCYGLYRRAIGPDRRNVTDLVIGSMAISGRNCAGSCSPNIIRDKPRAAAGDAVARDWYRHFQTRGGSPADHRPGQLPRGSARCSARLARERGVDHGGGTGARHKANSSFCTEIGNAHFTRGHNVDHYPRRIDLYSLAGGGPWDDRAVGQDHRSVQRAPEGPT
jgi:hypothetical protein